MPVRGSIAEGGWSRVCPGQQGDHIKLEKKFSKVGGGSQT